MGKRFTICEAIQVKVVVMSSVLLSFCFALKKREKKAVQMLPLETGCTIRSYIGSYKVYNTRVCTFLRMG